jgi:hypothetical protein
VAVTTFTCAACRETFDRDPEWSEEEAKAEHGRVFGMPIESVEDGVDVVCDDCYRNIVDWAKREGLMP